LNGDGRTDLLVGINGDGQVYLTQPSETATATANVAPVAVGSHLVDASYAGDNHYNSSTSATIPLWGQLPATSTSLTLTSQGTAVTSVPSATAVTLTAKVLVGANAMTNGQVNFCDASASTCSDIHLLMTAQLTSAGTATYTFVPSPGTHSYKAEFVQDGFGLASSSAALSLSVGPAPSVVYSDAVTISNGGDPGNYSLTGTVVGFGGSAAPTGTISFVDTSFGNTSLASAALGAATPGLGLLTSSIAVSSGSPYSQVVGDFNGDGIPDLAMISGDQYSPFEGPFTISVELGNGDGSFRAGPTFTPSGLQQYPLLIAGDFNQDGKTDLGVLSYDGYSTSYITTLPGNGDGSFGAPQTGVAYNQGPLGGDVVPGSVLAADFNGDGKLDLAVAGDYANFGGISVLLGKGDGTFTAEPQIATNLDFGAIVTGDLTETAYRTWLGLDTSPAEVPFFLETATEAFASPRPLLVSIPSSALRSQATSTGMESWTSLLATSMMWQSIWVMATAPFSLARVARSAGQDRALWRETLTMMECSIWQRTVAAAVRSSSREGQWQLHRCGSDP
jgi:hypothetical protein